MRLVSFCHLVTGRGPCGHPNTNPKQFSHEMSDIPEYNCKDLNIMLCIHTGQPSLRRYSRFVIWRTELLLFVLVTCENLSRMLHCS